MSELHKRKPKVEAEKKFELVEEELAAHRLQNSRLSLTNQRLQEEVSKVVQLLSLDAKPQLEISLEISEFFKTLEIG